MESLLLLERDYLELKRCTRCYNYKQACECYNQTHPKDKNKCITNNCFCHDYPGHFGAVCHDFPEKFRVLNNTNLCPTDINDCNKKICCENHKDYECCESHKKLTYKNKHNYPRHRLSYYDILHKSSHFTPLNI